MQIPRNRNSNTNDLEINIDAITFYGAFYQLDLGNATIQLSLETSLAKVAIAFSPATS